VGVLKGKRRAELIHKRRRGRYRDEEKIQTNIVKDKRKKTYRAKRKKKA